MRRARPGRRPLLVAVLGALCVLLAGCTAITTLINTERALRDAGYQSVSVNFSMGSGDEVDASVSVAAQATDGDAQAVARVVWDHFHERFQTLHVTVNGTGGSQVFRVYEYQDLVSLFGPRNPAWDRTTVSSATETLGAFVVGAIALVVVVIIVVVVIATRRKRRDRGGGYPGGRWQPGVGWQPEASSGWRPSPNGAWQPSAGGPWAPNPLWPAPQDPPPRGAPAPPGAPPPEGQPPPQAQGGPPPQGGSGWGSPPREGE